MESVRDHKYTAVRSAHGTGKSHVAARIATWWIDTHPLGSAKVLTSAPTFHQVRSILWGELARAHRKGNLKGRLNQTEWLINGELVGFGRKPADPAKGGIDETVTDFQGTHAEFLLVIFDEADGIPKPLWLAAQSLLMGEQNRFLAIGNPDNPQSHFATVCAPGSPWNKIHIPLSATPKFTGEVVHESVWKMMPDQQWIDDFVAQFGKGNAYKSKVLAEFPETSLDGVIPWSFFSQGKLTEEIPDPQVIELGVDVAGSERGDETVIRARTGNVPGQRWGVRTQNSEDIVGLVMRAIRETRATRVKIDVIGVGFGVAGHLRTEIARAGLDCGVFGVNVASQASDTSRFKNLRAELWWSVGREGIRDGRIAVSSLDDKTVAELVAPQGSFNALGQYVVEPKEKTRERLERSPDDADALLLAFYAPSNAVMSTSIVDTRLARRR